MVRAGPVANYVTRPPSVSTYTILNVLHEAGYSWRGRSWSQTVRKCKSGKVVVIGADAEAKETTAAK